jgi:hypothetical protein
MKHLDPLRLAELSDAAPSAAEAAHLRACLECAAELRDLRSLASTLRVAPELPAGLRQRTLQRLGLAPERPRYGWRWGVAGTALASALLLWIQVETRSTTPLAKAPETRPEPAHAQVRSSKPEKKTLAAKRPAAASAQAGLPVPAPNAAATDAGEQVVAPSAIGAIEPAAPAASVQVSGQQPSPKASPAPLDEFKVDVRNNLVRDGQPLRLRLSLPGPASLLALVLDKRGRTLARLHDSTAAAGDLDLHWDAAGAPSGAYDVLLVHGGVRKTIHCIVVR